MEAEPLSISLKPAVESPGAKRSDSAASPDGEPSPKKQKLRDTSPLGIYPKFLSHGGLFHKMMQAPYPDSIITIDNASVLELWASVVIQTLHPDLSWKTSLSAGNATSRMVRDGVMQNDPRRKDKVKQADLTDGVLELDVMRFNLVLENNLVVVDGEVLPGDEKTSRNKFATSDDYQSMKSWLELTAAYFIQEQLAETALDIFHWFKPAIDQRLDPWSTETIFNFKMWLYCDTSNGMLDPRGICRGAEEQEQEFLEGERLTDLEEAAAKKRARRTRPKPTPRRVTRAEAASRRVSSPKVFTTSPNPRQRRHGRGVRE